MVDNLKIGAILSANNAGKLGQYTVLENLGQYTELDNAKLGQYTELDKIKVGAIYSAR